MWPLSYAVVSSSTSIEDDRRVVEVVLDPVGVDERGGRLMVDSFVYGVVRGFRWRWFRRARTPTSTTGAESGGGHGHLAAGAERTSPAVSSAAAQPRRTATATGSAGWPVASPGRAAVGRVMLRGGPAAVVARRGADADPSNLVERTCGAAAPCDGSSAWSIVL